jgi:hypothetical protein
VDFHAEETKAIKTRKEAAEETAEKVAENSQN